MNKYQNIDSSPHVHKSYKSKGWSYYTIYTLNGFLALICVNGIFSILSCNAFFSILSLNSVFSILSMNSAFTIGCSGKSFQICWPSGNHSFNHSNYSTYNLRH